MIENRQSRPRIVTYLSVWLTLLGVFALVGSLSLWGERFLFSAPLDADHILPVTDLLVTMPIAFIAVFGLWRMTWWGFVAALLLVGILLYSSVAVYVMLAQQGPPYPIQFMLPPISGLALTTALVIVLWRNRRLFDT